MDEGSDDALPQVAASAKVDHRLREFDRKLITMMSERKAILSPETDSKLLEMVGKLEKGTLDDLGYIPDPLAGAHGRAPGRAAL